MNYEIELRHRAHASTDDELLQLAAHRDGWRRGASERALPGAGVLRQSFGKNKPITAQITQEVLCANSEKWLEGATKMDGRFGEM